MGNDQTSLGISRAMRIGLFVSRCVELSVQTHGMVFESTVKFLNYRESNPWHHKPIT